MLLFLGTMHYIEKEKEKEVPVTKPVVEASEMFLRFSRRKMAALFAVVIVVGAVGLALMLTPVGPTWRLVARTSLIPVALAIVVFVQLSIRGRRWAPDSPEVRLAMQDEWQRTNIDRATRVALVTVLLIQWPLALLFGLFMQVPAPRASMAMGMATITIGLATQLALFLYFDRE